MKVLVLDDETLIRQTLADYFEDFGIACTTTGSAEEAIEALRHDVFEACTVDMRLPGKDGNDFIREAVKSYPSLAFLVYTGSTNYVLPEDLSLLRPNRLDVIEKPAPDLSSLVQALKRLCAGE